MNLEIVEQIVTLLNDYPVTEITVEQDGQRVSARKAPAPATVPAPPAPQTGAGESPVPADEPPILLTAPMVGLFHHLPQPIGYGGLVTSGQPVGSIESMKLMNDVQAEQGGRVVEVLVEDGAPVEYGQPLFRLLAA